MVFQKSGFLDVFFFLKSLIWRCLYLVVDHLYLFLGSLLLIVDFESAWRVFFTSCLDVAKGFFLTMERILWSSTTVVFCGHPVLFVLLSSPFSFCFLRMYQTGDLATPNVPAISLMFFFFFKPNTCLFLLQGDLLWPHDVGSEQQLPNANGTLRINSKTFNWCKNNEGIAHVGPWNSFWVNCPITYGPLKKGGGTY